MTHSNSFVNRAAAGSSRASLSVRVAIFALLALLLSPAVLTTSSASAQTPLIHHVITKQKNQPPPLGRDFWFSMMSNYWGEDLGGKYMRIYITSPNNCTAFVESEGTVSPQAITAYQITSFKIPEFWEVESSGIVENKAIHVYSNTADLCVYDMSHNPYTSDGSLIIPTIGWGTDYVVGAYGSLFEGFGTYVYDLPSTMVVTADQDNTSVDITPSCDCRQCTSGNAGGDANSTIVVYPANGTYNFILNRGQCVQMMPVKASNSDNFDMTGTLVHANQPVGVSGGSVCPNIPADFAYCDHVEDMLPPVRTWAENYYCTNYLQPPGETNKDFARYLFISSVPNQTIYRQDCNRGTGVECNISNQFGIYWDEQEDAIKFFSAYPFLCVSYLNSATYPDGVNGLGDPAETIINPKEQYTKTVVFETPLSVGNIVPYTNYANVCVAIADVPYTSFDNQPISGYTYKCVDDSFQIYNIPKIAPGAHTVIQDVKKWPQAQGAGVYIYGYGYDESYAWAGSFGNGTFHSPDTVAPLADTMGACLQAFVHVTDSGLLPDGVDKQSGLSDIRIDSLYNMNYLPDPGFVTGSGVDTNGYGIEVTDPTQPAILVIQVLDVAGNVTTITSTYKPLIDSIKPPINNLGVSIAGAVKIGYDTIFNSGQVPFSITDLYLKYGNKGFSIYDSIGGPLDKSPIPPGQWRVIQVQFVAQQATPVTDSIIVGDTCLLLSAAVIGSGGADDFAVTSQTWPGVAYNSANPACYQKTVMIENLSKDTITVDSAWWSDQVHFKAVSTFPDTILPSPASVPFTIEYCPDAGSLTKHDSTNGSWFSPKVVEGGQESPRFDNLVGWAVAPSETFAEDTVINDTCPTPGEVVTANFTIASIGTSTSTINRVYESDTNDFYGLIGTLDNGTTWNPSTSAQQLAPAQTATISVKYAMKGQTDTTLVDNIIAVDGQGDTIGQKALTVTINEVYRAGAVNPIQLSYGPVQYHAAANNAKTFVIQNTAESPLVITGFTNQPSLYNGSFSFTPPPVFPITIPVGGSSPTFTLDFNDSLSEAPLQDIQINIESNSCTDLSITASAAITHPNPTVFAAPPLPAILSCDTQTSIVGISNPGVKTGGYNAADTVISVQWVTPTANFVFDSTQVFNGMVINGTTNYGAATATDSAVNSQPAISNITITFKPTPQGGLPVTYNDMLQIKFINSDNDTTTQVIPVTGTAGSAEITASAVVKNNTVPAEGQSGYVANTIYVPTSVSSQINVNGVTIDQLGITGVQLTYIIPQRDLLTFQSFTIDPNLSALGWSATSVKNTTPNKTGTADTIVYMLSGTNPLSGNITGFGQLNFQADLDKSGNNTTPVSLQPIELLVGGNTVGACVGTDTSSQAFSLVLQCGDSTLRAIMDGQGGNINFIGAPTPDPVTGGSVTVKYANRGGSTIQLSIYDELGNEVIRPVDNVYQEAGAWQVTTDVSHLPSGTYTYRLSGTTANGPMVLSSQFVIQR